MKNFVQEGDSLEVTAPYALTSGQGCLVGFLFGIATMDAAISTPINIQRRGVFSGIPKLSTDVIAAGASVYWDDTNRRLTVTAAGNVFVGWSHVAAGNGVTTTTLVLANVSKVVG